MQPMSDRLDLPGQFFAMPTALFIAFGPSDKRQLILVRVDPGDVDLHKQVELDTIAEEVAEGRLDPTTGVAEIEADRARPSRMGRHSRSCAAESHRARRRGSSAAAGVRSSCQRSPAPPSACSRT